MLFPYVDWVIAEALKNGINRLYFVARDGYILQKIANIIIKEKRLRLRTQYIYGSRQAWRLPALTADNIDKLIFSNFFYAHDAPSLEEFADFFGLTLSDIIAAFPEGKALARKNIPPNQYEPFRAAILRNRKIIDKILRFCKGKKDVLVAYLRQECNFVDNNFAFVELCGSGATQDCLADIILSCFPSTLCKTFYFDLSQQNNNVPGNSIKLLMFPRSGAYKDDLLEIMCRAPHGQTIGYKEHNGHIEPTLSGIEGVKIVEWGFCHYISGIEQYVKNIVSSLKNNDWLKITTNQYAFYHRRLAVFPDREFAEIMGRVPFSGSATQKEPGEYAPVFSLAEAVGRFLLNRIPPVTWWKGSIARGTKRISVFILKLRSLYYMARRFIFYVSRDSSSITVCILGIVFCVKK
jgi:predicted HAD superfamily hydrolase